VEHAIAHMNWRFVRLVTKIPFFHYASYVVIGVPLLAELFNQVHPYFPHTRFPHLLIFGFAAGVMFVFSEVVYHLACPEIVKRYETETEYVEKHRKEYEDGQRHQRINVVLPNLEPSEDDFREELRLLVSTNDTVQLNNRLDVLYPIAVGRFLWNEYRRQAASRIVAAWVVFVLYAAGIVLALFVIYGRLEAVWEAAKAK
jgi:hypothetical protein